MRIRVWQADLLMLLVTGIWGATFPVVQAATNLSGGGVPTYWFLAARFTLAALLLGAIFFRRIAAAGPRTWAAGALVGLFLFAGFAFQTFGLALTSSAKAGFITGLNVAIVPVLSVVWLKRKPRPAAWLGVAIATVGLGLLSLNANLMPSYGDLLVFLCAVSFALHITSVSRFSGPHDPFALAVIQIAVAAGLSWSMHLFKAGSLGPGVSGVIWWSGPARVAAAWLICGVLATALAFLLQNLLQPFTTPTRTALIFAAEPVWAAIFSYLLLGESLSVRGYVGAAMILGGMLLAELPGAGQASAEGAMVPSTQAQSSSLPSPSSAEKGSGF